MDPRVLEQRFFRGLMYISLAIVLGSLLLVFAVIAWRGAGALSIAMLTQVPQGGYYLGKEGGVLNAIVGSLYLAGGAILLATAISLPTAWFLQNLKKQSKVASAVRMILDISAGIPSLIYGAFVFLVMILLGARASLFWGIVTVGIFIVPLLTRAMDEVMQMVPARLSEASLSMGATRLETIFHVVTRQALPGLITAVLVAFGRGIGDAASVLFTAGYTDSIPASLSDPVATLPLAIFFQLGTPFPAVQQRAYACGIILLVIVLVISIGSRYLSRRFTRYVLK